MPLYSIWPKIGCNWVCKLTYLAKVERKSVTSTGMLGLVSGDKIRNGAASPALPFPRVVSRGVQPPSEEISNVDAVDDVLGVCSI